MISKQAPAYTYSDKHNMFRTCGERWSMVVNRKQEWLVGRRSSIINKISVVLAQVVYIIEHIFQDFNHKKEGRNILGYNGWIKIQTLLHVFCCPNFETVGILSYTSQIDWITRGGRSLPVHATWIDHSKSSSWYPQLLLTIDKRKHSLFGRRMCHMEMIFPGVSDAVLYSADKLSFTTTKNTSRISYNRSIFIHGDTAWQSQLYVDPLVAKIVYCLLLDNGNCFRTW